MGKKYLSAGIVLGFLAWFGWIMWETPGRKPADPAPTAAPETTSPSTPAVDTALTPPPDASPPVPLGQGAPPEPIPTDSTAATSPAPTTTPTDIPASVAAGPASVPAAPATASKTPVESKTDLPALIKSAQDVTGPTTPALKALQGAYEGQLPASEFNKEPWLIEMRNQWTDDGSGRYTVDYEILLNGGSEGRIGRNSGTGSFKAVRTTGDDGGLLVEVTPEMFMHLFYEPQTDDFTGIFYSMDTSGATRVHGKLVLTRK